MMKTKAKPKVFFRADGHSEIGLGHIVRSLALAKMIKSEFDCYFAIQNPSPALRYPIMGQCRKIVDLVENHDLEAEAHFLVDRYLTGDEIVVLDGYHFGSNYQKILKDSGCKVVCLDDIHQNHFYADVIINHAGGIEKEMYSAEKYTEYCLGTNYALLRKPFLLAAKDRRQSNRFPIVFICLGGADPKNDTLKVLKRCEEIEKIKQCYVVVGSAYRYRKELEEYMTQTRLKITLLQNLDAEMMISFMRLCPIAICTPSSVAYEYLCVGGMLYLHQIADNQTDLRKYLVEQGVAFDFDEFPVFDFARLENARRMQEVVLDGDSEKRLLKVFRKLDFDLKCNLRPATIDDMMLYFRWANDPSTREQSFNKEAINLTSHKHWFSKQIFNANSFLYVMEHNGKPVGQIRFEVNGKAILSYSVGTEFRGKGFGAYLLEAGIKKLKEDLSKPVKVVGFVKKDNVGSNIIFKRLGFKQTKAEDIENTFQYQIAC